MDFLKKHGLQAAALLMCLALAAAAAAQSAADRRLREEVRSLAASCARLEARLDQAQDQLLALKEGQAALRPMARFLGYSVREMDPQAGTFTLEISFEGEGMASWDVVAHMRGEAAGLSRSDGVRVSEGEQAAAYAFTLPLDLDAGGEFVLRAVTEGTERRQVLYRFDSVLDLLPVRMVSYSGEMGYNKSGDGKMYQAHREVQVADGMGDPADVTGGEFQLYKNGELALSAAASSAEPGRYSGIGLEGKGVPCGQGDRMELRFACTDMFGLRYSFPLTQWEVLSPGQARETWPPSAYPAVIWPQ